MKKKMVNIFSLVCFVFFMPLSSVAIEGLPGGNWVSLNHDVGGITGSGGMGWINQGVDWVILPGDITFNTYVEYGLRARSKEEEYFNAKGPSVGIELSKSYFTAGVDYYWIEYPEYPEDPAKGRLEKGLHEEGYEYTFGWYYSKDLKPDESTLPLEGIPFSTWAKLSNDASGPTGSGGMGWIQQGIDWITLPGDINVNTFVKYSYRAREKEKEYYNAQGPSIGIEFSKSYFNIGVSRYWEAFPESPDRNERKAQATTQYFAGWYYPWDLMDKSD